MPLRVPLMFTPERLEDYVETFPEHCLLLPEDYFIIDLTRDWYPVEGYCAAEVPWLYLKGYMSYKIMFVNGREVIDLTDE